MQIQIQSRTHLLCIHARWSYMGPTTMLLSCTLSLRLASRYFTNIEFKGFTKLSDTRRRSFIYQKWFGLKNRKHVKSLPCMYVCSQPFTRDAMFMTFTNLGEFCWKYIWILHSNITGFPHRWSKRSWSVSQDWQQQCLELLFAQATSLLHHLRLRAYCINWKI